ncbi:hypothetical protein JQ621_01305 [Bradyrhizobium manausense]|uniref:hypothetical protein n=1 Tax=Bradyrhizobium manausense TaxID=989370 RepID=UPI001BAC3E19|nr:hypothetical protein [Bradyrhizobium manausense]MBR1086107.1 hypothetical protein [Bradyrhizobium manausense]
MDYFRENSANFTSRLSQTRFQASIPENRVTHKRWAKAVFAFYSCLFLLGAIAIGLHWRVTTPVGTEQLANASIKIPARH